MRELIKQIKENDGLFFQFVRYTFVGGMAFLIDFSVLYVMTDFVGVHYLWSAASGFLLGLIFNYLLSVLWVFKKRSLKSVKIEFLIFLIIGLGGLALNEFFIWFFTDVFLFYYLFSKIISTVFVYLWNFFARRFVLFR